ncbi:hypothetical protein EJ419_02610 [Alloscardovia theropitheci]|uniref:Glycosyltransferase n=1 Tax=Alloscardovia theropitheci TaxID=2496842 RepID=A0A4R0QQK9_9BIFI|nr:hypothetical protein [Alloscardovia theropitheci]TCD54612.1 hypothetical protein EJ419_02610 [Alloscardovia theropitheci]
MTREADSSEKMGLAQACVQAARQIRSLSSTQQSIDSTITAVITVEDDTRYLPDTLAAVMNQTVLPGNVIIVNCAHDAEKMTQSDERLLRTALDVFTTHTDVVTSSGRSYGEAVTQAINHALDSGLIANSVEYLWLLHDDSRPLDNTYVDTVNEVRHNNASVSIIGAKQLSWDGQVLANVGYYAQRYHRITSLVVDGEMDQDQYDSRQDVYAVSLTGSFVRISDWMRLGGFSNALGTFGQSRDFGRRVARSGGRVIVEPRARIGHRRARFEGVRTPHGTIHECIPEDLRTYKNSAFSVFASRDAYFYSDMSIIRWIYLWPLSLFVACGRAIASFIRKQPYEAICELIMPWHNLIHCVAIASARTTLSSVQKLSVSKLSAVSAKSEQVRVYKDHINDLFAQYNNKVISPMVRVHLQKLARQRYAWLALITVAVFAINCAVNFAALRALFAGEHLASSTLISTASSTRELFDAATTPYSFAVLEGASVPSSPFLLIYALASLFTFGHAYATSALIILASVPAAVMSMWALAGIFTRSNIARITIALAWVASGFFTGVFVTGNLAMMVTYVFLPAGAAFAAKAVGVYQTEDPIESEPSIQASAWAALCFAVVSASEPQLFLIMIAVALVLSIIYRHHVLMIASMGIPSIVVLFPTIVAVIRQPQSWAQLFADIANTAYVNASVLQVFVPGQTQLWGSQLAGTLVMVISIVASIMLVIMAVISLTVPSLLKPSRSMWAVILAGLAMSVCAPHIAVSLGSESVIYASVLPASSVVMMALLTLLAMMSGPATTQFIPVLTQDKLARQAQEEAIEDPALRGLSRSPERTAFAVSRGFVVAICALMTLTWAAGASAFFTSQHTNVHVSSQTLPIVAQEYVTANPARRIAVVQFDDNHHMNYSILSSAHGDIITSSAAVDASRATGIMTSKTENNVAQALAQLVESNDDDSITALSNAGIGGIYVMYSGNDIDFSTFVSNASGTNNTETVVNNNQGAYIRISIKAASEQGVDMSGYNRIAHSTQRYVWIGVLITVGLIYLILAMPRFFARGE